MKKKNASSSRKKSRGTDDLVNNNCERRAGTINHMTLKNFMCHSYLEPSVKAGRSSGSIEIELCNEGPMAYRPNDYGKRINILRKLSANGWAVMK
ncbi:hypothetical protein NQ318_022784 [Aromia moschata]|uniref:Uncharacterized protein n=1 Tax=Aromia moschata TaxID=1265417 RepID=A0AAV8YED9_9CUCU|nr:hypothetical protein NQ318_022784 [Aromia moschata]